MRVIIVGAGSVGRSIARELTENNHSVLLLDRNSAAEAKAVATGAQFEAGDACEISFLTRIHMQQADVMVAATGDDKVNLVVSLLAKTEYAVPRTVARISNPKNEWMFDSSWGVDVAVSTPRIMTALVEEAVSVGQLVRMFTFHDSNVNMVELTLREDSPVVGRVLRSMKFPPDTVLVGILRDNRPLAPGPDDALESGDELLFMASSESESALQDLLAPDEDDLP
ncbi:TrkA family potassium uptake protein [Micrococcales bacterium 31B]|nr:TrkA family potassium uptake protein [Micrococcales bacterium 31B]